MAEEQTDWLTVGARRTKAQRLLETIAMKEEERMRELQRRRHRLSNLLNDEEQQYHDELQERYCDIEREQLEKKMRTADELRALEEEARVKFVLKADAQRNRQQCHHYREAYSREIQRYLNETRSQEITLRDQMRKAYGIVKSAPAIQPWNETGIASSKSSS